MSAGYVPNLEEVRRLREETGAGVMDCKRALAEAGGDMDTARALLREWGVAKSKKLAARVAREGLVEAYVHGDGRIGVLVEVNCETDFVARTDVFRQLAHDLALQVAAMDPRWVRREDVPPEVVEAKKALYAREAAGKPPELVERIVQGKLEAFFRENCLLEQDFIKDEGRRVGDLVAEVAAKTGENIVVRRFARFRLGEEA